MSRMSAQQKENRAIELVIDLERARGNELRKEKDKRAGFNGLSVRDNTILRKIEIKAIEQSDDWFAINGQKGIESLFFDPQYYLYFVEIREERILIAQAMPFLLAQIPSFDANIRNDMKNWLDLTSHINEISGLKIIPRINFKLRVGIRQLIKLFEDGQHVHVWIDSVSSVWSHEPSGNWRRTYPSPDN